MTVVTGIVVSTLFFTTSEPYIGIQAHACESRNTLSECNIAALPRVPSRDYFGQLSVH